MVVPPPRRGRCCSCRSSTGRAGASAWPTSTTAARPATAAHIATCCRASGASLTWKTASRSPPTSLRADGDPLAVDGDRLAITGGSAGGYTTLAALAFHDGFSAGASHFGVADLEALALDTHKFESRYLDGLIGPYPEARQVYVDRSPIHHVDGINVPLAVFQGLEDEIVPPKQSEMIVDALRAKGVPVAYLAFEGEQHGFRRAENIRRALDGELSFYAQVFGFTLPEAEGINRSPSRTSDSRGSRRGGTGPPS